MLHGRPEMPQGTIAFDPPPSVEQRDGVGGSLVNLVPMLGGVGSMVVVAGASGIASTSRSVIASGGFLLASLVFVVVQLDRQVAQRSKKVAAARARYLGHLAQARTTIRAAADQQRRSLTWLHPAPESLPAIVDEGSRLWERRSHHEAFLQVRYGRGDRPAAVHLVEPDSTPPDDVDPAAAASLQRLLSVQRVVSELPVSVDLRAARHIEVCGPEETVRSLARAMVAGAVAFHSPDELAVAVLASGQTIAHWDWVKWLPHARSTVLSDALGPRRMVATGSRELAGMLPADLGERAKGPHLLVVVDGGSVAADEPVVPAEGQHGVTVLDLPERWEELTDEACMRLVVELGTPTGGPPLMTALRVGDDPQTAVADQCDLATAEAVARRLAPLHTVAPGAPGRSGAEILGSDDHLHLLGLDDVHAFDPETAWRSRPAGERLRVPIGLAEDGDVVYLDLKESAQQGMGPHGLVIGATGSGKSELLRTLVLGLAATHSPEQLNMVLVDFKGGATFAGMSRLPHVSAVITNLSEELSLVDRMQDALSGELVRRQELLRASGSFSSVRDYERARADGAPLDPLPSLFIVVDEFSEMLTAKPEFIDLFVAIGRLGRSLGLHLLLASQRLEEGRLRGLESHLSYRIGLRTFSAAESRGVLGVPDAYELPAVPGIGFLRPDPATLLRFEAAYVSGPARRRTPPRRVETGPVPGILPFTVAEVQPLPPTARAPDEVTHPDPEPAADGSVLDLAVDRMAGRGPAAHQVWLPPLDLPDTVDSLMDDLVADPELGLVSPTWRALGPLVVPVGAVDRPREQRRDTLTLDLGGAAGHVVVVGGPRSGKSSLLRTVVAGLALISTPLESQFYVVDLGGGAFAPMAGLPHVAGIGIRSEPDVVRRIVAEVSGLLDRREGYFRAQGIDSVETYRARRAAGRADDGYGDVYLVVDGWGSLRADFDDLDDGLQQLAARGLTFGVHLLVASGRWSDFRAAVRDTFGTRLELRLGDPLDSEVDRSLAALVPAGRPGRGLLTTKLHFLAALPRVDGRADPGSLGEGIDDLVRKVRSAWHGPEGPKLRLLPELLAHASLVERRPPGDKRLVLGIDQKQLAAVELDSDTQRHLLVYGEGGSGKSAALRTYVREVTRTRTPREAQLVVVDYRRSLLGEAPDGHLLGYISSASQASTTIAELAACLESRLPGPEVTPEQLRTRSWWRGAEVHVVVDDYDLVSAQQPSPLTPLLPLLAQARDVGLHVVVARRSGGAGRAAYEPVLQALRELAVPGLVLSGSPDEGALVATVRPQPLPPGRGHLWTRERGVETVQVAWTDPAL